MITASNKTEQIIDKAAQWFFQKYIEISLQGKPLSRELIKIAREVGVRHPEKIRVIKIPIQEFNLRYNPCNPEISDQLPLLDMNRNQPICYKYGLVLPTEGEINSKTFVQLFRFIVFYERFGSLKNFVNLYFRFVLTFGWERNPFAADANQWAKCLA